MTFPCSDWELLRNFRMSYFDFKKFRVYQENSAFKIGTDGVLLGAWADASMAGNVLDIGTGTGLIALMIAQRSSCSITALEPDVKSYEEAVYNVEQSPWHKRINVFNMRLQDHEPPTGYDLIVTNPPFFRHSLRNRDPRVSKTRHNYDLDFSILLDYAGRMLSSDGKFYLVLPYAEAALFIADASHYGLYCNRLVKVKPLPSSGVKRMLMEFGKTKKQLHQSFLVVETGKRHEYSPEYKKLTADYYLAF